MIDVEPDSTAWRCAAVGDAPTGDGDRPSGVARGA
jgi:hypothetical protein